MESFKTKINPTNKYKSLVLANSKIKLQIFSKNNHPTKANHRHHKVKLVAIRMVFPSNNYKNLHLRNKIKA